MCRVSADNSVSSMKYSCCRVKYSRYLRETVGRIKCMCWKSWQLQNNWPLACRMNAIAIMKDSVWHTITFLVVVKRLCCNMCVAMLLWAN